MSFVSKLTSKIRFWTGGPLLRNVSGVIEARNAADSGYAIVRGGTPSGSNDLSTKNYADTTLAAALTDPTFNDSTDPTKEAHLVLSGITTANDRAITVPDKDITLAGTADISTAIADARLSNVESRILHMVYTNTGDNNLGAVVPAGANVIAAFVQVTTLFDGTTPVLKIGDAGTSDSVLGTAENDLTTVGLYSKIQITNFVAATQLLANLAIGGSPSQGACDIVVLFSRAAS